MELTRPFAENGDRIDFPEDAQGDGDLSLEQGFGPRFALPPEESGLFIDRQKYNQLMYLITKGVIDAKEAVKLMQQGMTEGLAKLAEFETKLSGFTTRLDSLEDEVANIDESLIGGKVITLVDEDIFITVGNPGSGAQFERLEDALYEGMKYKPINNHYVFVVLKTNLTIDYPIMLYGVDMSHIIISGWFDGTQGQVKPPMKEWKRIYYDVKNAIDRNNSMGWGFLPLITATQSQTFSSFNVVWSMKEPVDMTEINTKYSRTVLSYYNALFFAPLYGIGRFCTAEVPKYIIKRYNLDFSIDYDLKGLTGNAARIITAQNAFICYGGLYCVAGFWNNFLDITSTYIKNGMIGLEVGCIADFTGCVFHYTNKTPIIQQYNWVVAAPVHVYRGTQTEWHSYNCIVIKEDSIGYDYVSGINNGGIIAMPSYSTSPDLFYGKAPNIGLSPIANNTVTASGIMMSVFTYEQAKAAVRPYPTVYDEIYPDEPNWNQQTDYNPNTAWKPQEVSPPPVAPVEKKKNSDGASSGSVQ